MERQAYDKRSFRRLPREQCAASLLFGEIIGPCRGLIHRHHVDPDDPNSRTVEVCNAHHQSLHAALRALSGPEKEWKRCRHIHRSAEARQSCERRLNLTSAA